MSGNTTFLTNPDDPSDPVKKFTYDHSYWSHDGYKELPNGYCTPDQTQPNGSKFCDQERVYRDLGRGVLRNAWDGYNSALFAYGQTGSGKSWSVIGYGANKGIVPRFCEEMFRGIEDKKRAGDTTEFEVRFSMLEIYNEIVRDLLNPGGDRKRGLKVREHPKKGFYAEGLKLSMVTSYKEIERKLNEGTTNRSIASTNMNATSSRAHTIVGIHLVQKGKKGNGQETAKSSIVHLVDLAGSERAANTGATGDRLKEGAAINQSLSCLGNCIHALAERAMGKNTRVPFRDSVLTRLLMNALGGNSRTIMIASISPADINYEETLSTLRYADRAKQIKTVAIVNEDPTEKLIRELRQENERLKRMLEKGAMDVPIQPGMTEEEIERMKKKWEEEMHAAMAENDRDLQQIKQSYDDKLKLSRQQKGFEWDIAKIEKEKKVRPHFTNLNFDPMLSGKIVHLLKMGENIVGKTDQADIQLLGPSIQERHAIVNYLEHGGVTLEKCHSECRILLNGEPLTARALLSHCDRIMFGTTQLYVFIHPDQMKKTGKKYPEVTYEMAQEEIAAKAGISVDGDDQSLDTALLNKDLLEVLPGVEEANAISEELDKKVKFEIMLLSPQWLGKTSGRTEVYVKMRNLETGVEFEWPKDKFLNRMYVMKEMYQNYESGEEWDVEEDRDPFIEDLDAEVRIGSVQVFLQPLAYMVELKEQLEIVDYKGAEVGIMNIEVVPCTAQGKEYTEHDDMFVDNPNELIGKDLHFMVKLLGCRGLPSRFNDIRCKYKVYLDTEDNTTEVISDTSNPDFNHKRLFSFKRVTQSLVEYLKEGYIMVQVWGKQTARKSAVTRAQGKNTKEMFQADLLNNANTLMKGFRMNGRVVDPNKQSIIVELLLMKKQQHRQQQRLENIRRMIDIAETHKKKKLPVSLVKDLYSTTSAEVAEELLQKVPSAVDDADAESSICSLL
ncbi:kinesin-like protein KIF28P [Stegodyphus dumicola]|uniref:kinesin-like protein KIF28P n=1 Tax=Stegodyphus dumicola TaxID=202533 RepID=UPI0015AA3D8D|nr:kinesin-like protein KIF28P [Stegodyphus dumicola]